MKKEYDTKRRFYIFLYGLLMVLVLALLVMNLCIGSVSIPFRDLIQILCRKVRDTTAADIVYRIRFPRAAAAAMLGGGLALSGYLLQTFFHNPIAGPFILGISSGAKLAVALIMVLCLSCYVHLSSGLLITAAFAGAMLSMGFVLLMAKITDKMSILIISGVMIGYICSAITDFIVTFAADAEIVKLHNWSKGSFSGMSWDNAAVILMVLIPVTTAVFLLSKQIGAYQLGETYAESVGLNLMLFRLALVLLSGLLSACVTAFAGPVSFVGVAVPHLVKGLFRSSKPILLIPACFLGGAAFCLFSDLLARTIFAPTELSISTVTAIFGAPVVILILIRKKR